MYRPGDSVPVALIHRQFIIGPVFKPFGQIGKFLAAKLIVDWLH
jgi:hypothetical protein